ncbi:hypothetical protein LCGC14_2989460 [marine sediment metagenome]|uniref:Uncharacterized protein n=1 Tax=marine sediment metagenome TaxID=412755 RepID=A0A0F8X4B3_9ZZZZ
MADNTTILGKSIFAGGTEHLRDSDFEEYLIEGEMFVGDSLLKGTAETQVIGHDGSDPTFKGIAVAHSIRQSDLETYGADGDDRTDAVALLKGTGGGLLTPGKTVKVLKPTGGRTKVRAMAYGYTGGATIPSGSPVYSNLAGSTIGSSASVLGQFFIDPACTDDATIVGRLSKAAVAPDATTNDVNVEIEMWY